MEAISVLGYFAFWGSLFYLAYHLIKKRSDTKRVLPKKQFYSFLIVGFLLIMIGSAFSDTSIEKELNNALEKNDILSAEIEELKTANQVLVEENKELLSKLEEQKIAYQESTTALEEQILELQTKNTELFSEVDNLKNQIAKNSTAPTMVVTSSGGSSTSTNITTTSSSGTEWFQNCTELRKKYPNGVGKDHPAYQPKMDRYKDGWACER